MDFKQLEVFTKVIELESFTKAAEAVYLSQASVSLYVNALEKELNCQLIIRSAKNFMPTKIGEIFYDYAKNLLSLRNKAIYEIQAQKDYIQGEIEIMASSVPVQFILPEVLVHFNNRYPNITFKVIQSDTREVTQAVISQKCEIGIVGAKTELKKCHYEHIVTDSLVLIAPPLQKTKKINIDELADFFYSNKFITREQGSGTRYSYEVFLKEHDVDLEKIKVIASFSNTQSILQAVSKGLGISIVSKVSADEYIQKKQVCEIELESTIPSRHFYFVYKKNLPISPVVQTFTDFTHAYFQNNIKTGK